MIIKVNQLFHANNILGADVCSAAVDGTSRQDELVPWLEFKDSVGAHVLELQRALYEVEALVVRVAMWLEGIAGFVQPRERPETLVLDICDCLFLRLEEPLDNRDCCHFQPPVWSELRCPRAVQRARSAAERRATRAVGPLDCEVRWLI